MTPYERLQDEVAYGFRNLHGRCSVYIYRPISSVGCINKVLKLFFDRDMNRTVLIVCKDNTIRSQIANICNDKCTCITYKYYKDVNHLKFDLIINVNIVNADYIENISLSTNYRFYLNIFDKRDLKNKDTFEIESFTNFIRTTVTVDSVIEDYIHLPVKETLISVPLNDKHLIKYKEYDNYIVDSMRIFGDFKTLDNCRVGDKASNISNTAFCNAISESNGWSEEIDTSTPFGKEIDKLYNPIALYERACNVYNIIRERRNLVSNAEEKFPYIAELVNNLKDRKILIVSTNGTYAYKITEYLNNCNYVPECELNIDICGNYHDDIPDKIQTNVDGTPVLVKSGEHKGEPKVIGAIKQSTLAMNDFNDNIINILSIKSASNPKLTIDCDVVILTSPFASDIYELKRRFQNTLFIGNPFEVYTLYCNGTVENKKVDDLESTPIHEIIRDDENIFISE